MTLRGERAHTGRRDRLLRVGIDDHGRRRSLRPARAQCRLGRVGHAGSRRGSSNPCPKRRERHESAVASFGRRPVRPRPDTGSAAAKSDVGVRRLDAEGLRQRTATRLGRADRRSQRRAAPSSLRQREVAVVGTRPRRGRSRRRTSRRARTSGRAAVTVITTSSPSSGPHGRVERVVLHAATRRAPPRRSKRGVRARTEPRRRTVPEQRARAAGRRARRRSRARSIERKISPATRGQRRTRAEPRAVVEIGAVDRARARATSSTAHERDERETGAGLAHVADDDDATERQDQRRRDAGRQRRQREHGEQRGDDAESPRRRPAR